MKYLPLFIAYLLVACSNNDKPTEEPKPQAPLQQDKNSMGFTKSASLVLQNYYALTHAFTKEDTSQILTASTALKISADSLKINELKADENIVSVAKQYAANIADECKAMNLESNIDNKRKALQMITNDIFDLIRAVKYDNEKVYLLFCDKAFNNQGAEWLHNNSTINNPYIPKQNITCGEVKDSISFK
jgi:hypothetical protein